MEDAKDKTTGLDNKVLVLDSQESQDKSDSAIIDDVVRVLNPNSPLHVYTDNVGGDHGQSKKRTSVISAPIESPS